MSATGEAPGGAARSAAPSAWAPFGHRAFAVLWGATVVSNVGTWMHEVGAGWLMTELSPSPLLVAAVQAAATLPMCLFALPAGALADIVDRRRLLLLVNAGLLAAAAALAALVAAGAMTPALLLAFTLAFGTGAAFIAPAWQAIVPGLVPRDALQPAIALNSMGINVSRAIGPALAGALIVALGLWSPFALNAASFLVILAALAWWRPAAKPASALPPEPVAEAIATGLRHALASPPLLATLARAAAFFAFASAFWAMLPLVTRGIEGGGATLYGLLLGAVGAGAVGGALVLPRIRRTLGPDATVAAGTLGTALAMAALAAGAGAALALAAALLAGLSWIAVLSSLNVSAQTVLPDWVRARGLAVFLTVFFGSMALGSLVWGQVAASASVAAALGAAALGAVLAIPAVSRFRLNQGAAIDHAPAMHWPEPVVAGDPDDTLGPVAVRVAYRVAEADRPAFLALMRALASARRRHGGHGWRLMRDAADAEAYVETWTEPSWAAHRRHHARVTGEDRRLQAEIARLHRGDGPPAVEHLLPAEPSPKAGDDRLEARSW